MAGHPGTTNVEGCWPTVATEPVSLRAASDVVVVRLSGAGTGPRRQVATTCGEAAHFDARAMRDLPSAEDLWSLVDSAAPFVIADRVSTGGLGTGRSALVGSRGESWGLTTVLVDGLPVVRLPTLGNCLLWPDMNAASL